MNSCGFIEKYMSLKKEIIFQRFCIIRCLNTSMNTNQHIPFTTSILYKLGEHLSSYEFDYFVTLSFNDYHSVTVARDKVKAFQARMDRKLLGRKWYKKPTTDRLFFIAFPEHINSNFHYHLLLKFPKCPIEIMAKHMIDCMWKDIVPKGSTNTQLIQNDGCIQYCLKEQYKSQNYGSFIISSEFNNPN